MWKTIRMLLILLSVGFNAAFGAMWVREAVQGGAARTEGPVGPAAQPAGAGGVWWPLHRSLGVSEAQWQTMEPRLIEFQKASEALDEEGRVLRAELLDLAAAPQVDREAIRAKQQQILSCQTRMQDLVVSHLLAERQSLTPEQQKALFAEVRRQCGCVAEKCEGMSGRGHGAGMGMRHGREVPGED
jgi:Spy/CpxP family protein refolding chaperone